MTRTVYIDISAKVEEWGADSVIAMTNGGETVLILASAIKRQARDWLKASDHKPRKEAIYIYRLLAIMICLIAGPELQEIESIIIDNDYPGDGPISKIKNELVPLLKRKRPEFDGKRIAFQQVKGKRADHLAREVYQAKRRPYQVVKLREIQNAWQ